MFVNINKTTYNPMNYNPMNIINRFIYIKIEYQTF